MLSLTDIFAVSSALGDRDLDTDLRALLGFRAWHMCVEHEGEKLRRHGVLASHLQVFMHTSPFAAGPARSVSGVASMREPTSDTIELVRGASHATRRLWASGYRYAKAGVILDDLVKPAAAPRALIDPVDPRRDALMTAMDDINARFGRGSLFPGSTGVRRAWTLKADMRSPAYTSRLAEVPTVWAG